MTLDVPNDVSDEVSVDDIVAALAGVQDAVRLMVGHLGGRRVKPGQKPNWLVHQSTLRLTDVRRGSLVAELALADNPKEQAYLEPLGETAIDSLIAWDGTDDSDLPALVVDRLRETASSLSSNTKLWFGDEFATKRIEIKRKSLPSTFGGRAEEALVFWMAQRSQLGKKYCATAST